MRNQGVDQAPQLNHFDDKGQAWMVDIAHKPATHRQAIASGFISLQTETLKKIAQGEMGKGDVLGIARIAGIMAAKRCSELIPLCHPLGLTHASVQFTVQVDGISTHVTCATTGSTGVEMEALTACSITLLTIYDMCKAVDKTMVLSAIRLEQKTGGTSDLPQAVGKRL